MIHRWLAHCVCVIPVLVIVVLAVLVSMPHDGIKAGQTAADLDTIVARIDVGLQRARELLAK